MGVSGPDREELKMKTKGAMNILERRAEFYGQTVETLVVMLDNGFDEISRVMDAYKVYKSFHVNKKEFV